MKKRYIITSVAAVAAFTGLVMAQAGTLPTQHTSTMPTGTQEQVEAGAARPDPAALVTTQPATDGTDSTPTDTTGPAAAAPTDEGTPPADEPAPVDTTGPAEAPAPPVVRTGYHMRFADISPADKPNTKAEQYCDYSMSDGSTQIVWVGSITHKFTQPIENYNEDNTPGIYTAC